MGIQRKEKSVVSEFCFRSWLWKLHQGVTSQLPSIPLFRAFRQKDWQLQKHRNGWRISCPTLGIVYVGKRRTWKAEQRTGSCTLKCNDGGLNLIPNNMSGFSHRKICVSNSCQDNGSPNPNRTLLLFGTVPLGPIYASEGGMSMELDRDRLITPFRPQPRSWVNV